MRNDLKHLGYESLIWGDFAVPVLHKLPNHDGQNGVQLQINIVATSQRGKQLLDGSLSPAFVPWKLWTKHTSDEVLSGAIRERVIQRSAGRVVAFSYSNL